MYADRAVMPCVLQKRILKEFHMGHPGIYRKKSLIRTYTYWPKMDQDIEKRIREYKGCQLVAKAPTIKTQPWPKTDIPWTRIHIDYAGPLKGRGCPRGVMVNAMDCGIVVSEFVLQSCYYVHLRANTLEKDINPLIPPTMG